MKKRLIFMYLALISMSLKGGNSIPSMSRVRGDQYTQAIAASQNSGLVGTLDSTFNSSSGSIGSVSVDAQLTDGQAQVMQVLLDGTFFVAMSQTGSDSNLGKYNAEGTLLTSFGVSGIVDLGALTAQAQAMMIDTQGRILVAGGLLGHSAGWLNRVSADGMSLTSFATGVAWQYIAAIAEQQSGQIITAGFNGFNAQIARYNLDGSHDLTFGSAGFIVLDGSASGASTLPIVTTGLHSVVVDAGDLIYVAYVDSVGGAAHVARFTSFGFLDTTFGTQGIANISYLNSAILPLYMAIDLHSNLIIASQIGSHILVTAISSITGGAAVPAFTNAAISHGTNVLSINNIITTSDGSTGTIFIVGSNNTLKKSRITRLTNTGILDLTFNETGFNEFSVGSPSTSSSLYGSALSPDGQVYGVGYQVSGGVNTSYVSRLYNNFNTYQVSQSPLTQEQGTVDLTFGTTSTQTNPGIVTPFNGMYRGALQQVANDVIELAVGSQAGKLLVAMDGYSNTAAQSSMMLIRLLSSGVLDGSFGVGGKLTLPNLTASNEYLTSILEDGSGNIYVTGYASTTSGGASTGAIFRKYTAAGTPLWVADMHIAQYQGLGVAIEGTNRALLFTQVDATHGQISGHNVSNGAIDTAFNSAGTPPGYVLSTDYPGSVLNMGPVFGGVVDSTGDIFIAYKDSVTGAVDAAAIFNAAPGLISSFGSNGIVHNIFSSLSIPASNVHVAFDYNFNIIVAVASGTTMQVALLNAFTGTLNAAFNGGHILTITIPGSTSVMLESVLGISDGSLVLTGYDDGTDDTMLVARVDKFGHLDTTFNSQGLTPGILALKIGDQIAYNARVATGLAIQSNPGSDQGNLVVSAYEKQFVSDATPIVLHVFGQPGTTGVRTSPPIVIVPGNPDPSYNGTGFATTYANGTSSPAANQQVKAIRQLIGVNIMTVISDGVNSWTTEVLSNGSLDTSYGVGTTASVLVIKDVTPGADVAEQVNGMVYDGTGRMLIYGNNASLGGYVKRVNINGSMDIAFGGFTGDATTSSYPAGTVYGLLSNVADVAELSTGEIVIVGNNNGVGTVMLLSATGVPITSNGSSGSTISAGFGSGALGAPGTVTYGVNMTSVSVDASDNIFISAGYTDINNNQQVAILKLGLTGAPVAGFGNSGAASINGIVTSALCNIDNFNSICLALDAVGKIIISASSINASSFGQVGVRRFDTDGLADATFIGDNGSGTQRIVVFPVASDPTTVTVTNMLSLQNGKTLISGYQYDSVSADNQSYEFIACLDPTGHMDGSFGSGATTGLVLLQVSPAAQLTRNLWDINTQTDGKILIAGAESPALNEEVPFTGRLLGYNDVQSIPQFSGDQPPVQDFLNLFFNETGITSTGFIPTLVDGGHVIVDFLGRPVIGGYTSDNRFVLARFNKVGQLDQTFGDDGTGIVVTDPVINFLNGSYVAVDSNNDILFGGLTTDARFILARFTRDGRLDPLFGPNGGIVRSAQIPNLIMGGQVTVDSSNRPVLGGMTSDGNLVAARFTILGLPDLFGLGGIAIASVPLLLSGGFIVTDRFNQVIVTGMTSVQTLVAVKFYVDGSQDTLNFGAAGVATTNTIPDMSMGGSVGLDSQTNIVIGAYTTNQEFAVVKFTQYGFLDTTFGQTGVAYSNPINILTTMGSLVVDSSDRIVIAGPARGFDGSISMIVARFSPLGIADLVFSPDGLGTTGPIVGLSMGGYVCTNVFDNIFIGGVSSFSSLIIAEMYSGEEIFITDVAKLTPAQYKIFRYGDNPDLFRKFLGVNLFATVITDPVAHDATVINVASLLDEYVLIYALTPGWNLIWHLYRFFVKFLAAEVTLATTYPASAAQIELFFANFKSRMVSLEKR